MSYTKGPWIDGKTSDSIIVKSDKQDETTLFYGGDVICESVRPKNKLLIKAAPEILEMLIKVYKIRANYIMSNYNDTQTKIKSIIERATGKTIEEVLYENN